MFFCIVSFMKFMKMRFYIYPAKTFIESVGVYTVFALQYKAP